MQAESVEVDSDLSAAFRFRGPHVSWCVLKFVHSFAHPQVGIAVAGRRGARSIVTVLRSGVVAARPAPRAELIATALRLDPARSKLFRTTVHIEDQGSHTPEPVLPRQG